MTAVENLKPIKKFDFLKVLKILFFSFAILYNSGYALVTVYSRNISILILAALSFVLVCLILLEKKYKKPLQPIHLIFLTMMGILLLFSTCLNFTKSEIGYSVRIFLILINSYMFTILIDFKTISYYFRKAMFIIALVSLVGFFMVFAAKFKIYRYLPTAINSNGVTYYNGLILFFGGHAPTVLVRNFGAFWEPGIYGSYLIIAMFLQMLADKNRINWVRQGVFTLAIITTFSTASFIILPFVALGYFFRSKNKQFERTAFFILILSFLAIILVNFDVIKYYLAQTLPSVFGKLVDATASGDTRLYSPLANWAILRDNSYIGLGFTKADILYSLKIKDYLSFGAQTSTSFYMMAVFGPLGIIYTLAFIYGISKQKSLSIFTKISFILVLLIVVNKEPHTYFLFTYMLIFYCLVPNSLEYERSEFEVVNEMKMERARTKTFDDSTFPRRLKHAFYNNKLVLKINNTFKKSKDNQTLAVNIFSSFGIKGIALVVSLLSTPAYVRYFSNDSNGFVVGVWFTMVSIFSWILNFDFGIGNGLRNRLVKAFVNKDKKAQKELISSGYIMLGLISLVVLIVGCCVIPFLNWNSLLNIENGFLSKKALMFGVLILFSGIILQFFLKLITSILYAMQKTALGSLLTLLSSISLLAYLVIAKDAFSNNNTALIMLSVAQVVTVNLPLLIATLIVFMFVLKDIRPNIKFYRKDCAREVTSLGLEFFAIQLCLLVINSTNEILITRLFAPNFVTEYTYYNKWFHMIAVLFTLMVQPMWSSVSKSYVQKDYVRIKKVYRLFNIISAIFVAGSVFLAIIMQPLMNFWLRENTIKVSLFVCLSFVLMTGITIFSTSATCIANGINKLKCQIICCVIGAVVKIPLSILIVKAFPGNWAIIILIHAIILLPLTIAQPIAVTKFINKKLKEQKERMI